MLNFLIFFTINSQNTRKRSKIIPPNTNFRLLCHLCYDPEREFAAGSLNPLRVRLRPARACQSGFTRICTPPFSLNLFSHITFFTKPILVHLFYLFLYLS